MTTTNWVEAARVDDIDPDEPLAVTLNGRDIALYKLPDGLYATDNLCTHAFATLSDGFLENGEIECPLHQGRFDVATGKALCEPATDDIRTYPVKVDGATVFVGLDGD